MVLLLIRDVLEFCGEYFRKYLFHLVSYDPPTIFVTSIFIIALLAHAAAIEYKTVLIRVARRVPGLSSIIQRKIDKAIAEIHDIVHGGSRVVYQNQLPEEGLDVEQIMRKIKRYKALEYIRWNEGFVSGAVYQRHPVLSDLSSKVFKEYVCSNPLHSEIFPDIRRMEAEVVRMCANMYHGDRDVCGTVTSGGTESIMLACLAYRELARSKGIKHPVMLIPQSAHPAFDKAAHYFNIEALHIPVNGESLKVDVKSMRRAITKNTCLLVGSAPCYPHGVIDPIKEIARLGQGYGIPVHVDCCLGGFLVPFMDAAGYPVEVVDFRLSGVTSISCDTHKYGFAAKGTSVILYRNKHYRSMQFFTQPNWSGGLYASPTFAGSRSGALIAVCWATMMHFGKRGYIEATRRIVKTARYVTEELRKIPDIIVYGDPQVSVVAFGSETFDIYQLSEQLSELPNGRGWYLNKLQFPPGVHFCVTDMHTAEGWAEYFIRDLSSVAAVLRQSPNQPTEGAAAMYCMCATIPDRSIVSEVAKGFLDACYDTPDPPNVNTTKSEKD